MRILVLGSEGFIGSNAVNFFMRKHYTVYKADITIKEEPNYFVINPELADFSSLFSERPYDFCLNATGAANVQFSIANPALDFSLNTVNVFHLLSAMRRFNPHCRFLNLSSAAVYGNPSSLPVSEGAQLLPLSPYGWHKLYSEQICNEFHVHFGLATKSARIFSAYGEGLKKQLFWDVYRKIEQARGSEVVLFGTGAESRDFIYIHDLLEAIECIALNDSFDGKAINIASGTETSIRQVVNEFVLLLQAGSAVRFSGQVKAGDPANWKADIRVLTTLGFTPQTSIEQGLKNYIQWVKGK